MHKNAIRKNATALNKNAVKYCKHIYPTTHDMHGPGDSRSDFTAGGATTKIET
jgi:hypothetical protein